MSTGAKTEIRSYGIRMLLSAHPEVRKLKSRYSPFAHGNLVWNSSWLLVDYLKHQKLPEGIRIMDVGCGWGLSGIYCAKEYGAVVTSVDIDPEVFPFLGLHAAINNVKLTPVKVGFGGLTTRHLAAVDVLIGADICFWAEMVDPLKKLFMRALHSGVDLIVIADPGRTPFEKLGEFCMKRRKGEIIDWVARRPKRIQGRILKMTSNRRKLELETSVIAKTCSDSYPLGVVGKGGR
jgi:predicted nicotinamide N-methyase